MDSKRSDAISIDGDLFQVLVNDEGQYSIWPGAKEVPAGWTAIGPTGGKPECIEFIEKNWIDMRPRSLQRAMEQESEKRAKESGAGS